MSITDTATLLRRMAGGTPDDANVRSVAIGLERYGAGAGLARPEHFAHYAAQLLHESARFRYDREIWGPTPAQRRYEDRADLGHSAAVPGEAFRFRGRSGIQLTGRHNYRAFTRWCREKVDAAPDFEAKPDLINTDPWEGLAPIWYWDAGNPTGGSLNVYARTNNAEAVTRKVNGGLNGFDDRLEMYVRAALVLLGYTLDEGVVRRFQAESGFTGREIDGIAGQQTRAALHNRLFEAPSLVFAAPSQPADPPDDLMAELAGVQELIEELARRLGRIGGRIRGEAGR